MIMQSIQRPPLTADKNNCNSLWCLIIVTVILWSMPSSQLQFDVCYKTVGKTYSYDLENVTAKVNERL